MWWFLPYSYMDQPWMHICTPILNPLPTSLPIPSHWVASEHWFWVSCFMHGTFTVICFIYGNTCFNAVLSNYPTLTILNINFHYALKVYIFNIDFFGGDLKEKEKNAFSVKDSSASWWPQAHSKQKIVPLANAKGEQTSCCLWSSLPGGR